MIRITVTDCWGLPLREGAAGPNVVSVTVSQAVFKPFMGVTFALASLSGRQVLAEPARLAERFAAMLHTRTTIRRGFGRGNHPHTEYQQHHDQ